MITLGGRSGLKGGWEKRIQIRINSRVSTREVDEHENLWKWMKSHGTSRCMADDVGECRYTTIRRLR
jgi:hypothetical protein